MVQPPNAGRPSSSTALAEITRCGLGVCSHGCRCAPSDLRTVTMSKLRSAIGPPGLGGGTQQRLVCLDPKIDRPMAAGQFHLAGLKAPQVLVDRLLDRDRQ